MGADLESKKGRLLFVFDLHAHRSMPLTSQHQYIGDGMAWSPEGDRVYYVAGGDVFVAPADGSGPTQLMQRASSLTFSGAQNLAVSPDGNALVFVRGEGVEAKADIAAIWRVNRDGSRMMRLSQ